jgi:hypothetical protein
LSQPREERRPWRQRRPRVAIARRPTECLAPVIGRVAGQHDNRIDCIRTDEDLRLVALRRRRARILEDTPRTLDPFYAQLPPLGEPSMTQLALVGVELIEVAKKRGVG